MKIRAAHLGASDRSVTGTADKMPRMSRRPRGRNGAEKRYKGPRELVGARVPLEVNDRVDDEREALGLTRNDYLFAAILVAFERPDEVKAAAATLGDMLPHRRTSPEGDQLRLAAESSREVFKRSA